MLKILSEQKDIIKNLLYLGNPVIIGIKIDVNFSHSTPLNSNDEYVYNSYNSSQNYGNHAMLIVGYDNTLQAFKVVNSWGSAWGNEGYCWISFNFFNLLSDADYQIGLLGAYTAYD